MSRVIPLKERNSKKMAEASADLPAAETQEVSATVEKALRRAAEKIVVLNSKSASHAFELGEAFAEAKEFVPEKKFGQWLKPFTDYTVRSAWNYISIHERLQGYRDELVAHAVMPTVMFELAKGEPAQIKAVIARMDAGERIRVADVKAVLGNRPKQKDDTSVLDIGGMAGLRKAAQLKTEADIAAFQALTSSILKTVEVALKPLAQKRAVRKGDLHKAVVYDCRHAHDLFDSIAAPLKPDVTSHMNWRAAKVPANTAWGKVQALLHMMGGGIEYWPDRLAFVPWLQNEVVPLMRFVVHGEAIVETEAAVDGELGANEIVTGGMQGPPPQGELESPVEQMVGDALKAVMSRSWYDRKRQINADQEPSEVTAA